ncbi:MAG TPA: FAD-dependent monooxygenase [Steroidobacteraceae bacterium]|nr:FAD-dependent monooxygenase [Steroidobacteraceae bacterium]
MQRVPGVVVVGAGPVGFLTALGVARGGIPVTVIEAEPAINDSPRATIYFPTTLTVLAELGLLEDALALSYISSRFSYRLLATGESIHVDTARTAPPDASFTYNAHFGQHRLAQLVSQHLLRLPNTAVRWSTRLVALESGAEGCTLTLESAAGREELHADWVVGADGARSAVRHLLGLAFEGHTWPERFVATNLEYDFERYGFEPANMVADPVNWAVVARLGLENEWRVTYAEDASISEEEARRRIPQHYAAILPDPEAPFRILASSPYRVHERCAPTFRVGRVLLAGDAAHACNPCGGMGLTGGVIDALALAQVLKAVVHGKAGEAVLDFYARERRRVFLEVSSPVATEMKRRMSEPDPARQRADFEAFRQQAESPEQAAMSTTLSKLVMGQPMPV